MKTETLHFHYKIENVVRLALQVYAENHSDDIKNEVKRMATAKFAHGMLSDDLITRVIDKWQLANDGQTVIFDTGLDNDAMQMWGVIWKTEEFRAVLESSRLEFIRLGKDGSGVLDESTGRFYPCGFCGHYNAIELILQADHKDLFEVYEAYKLDRSVDISAVDKFVMKELELIGANRISEFYTPSNYLIG